MSEVVPVNGVIVRREQGSNYRREVPKEHRYSIATRLQWLWNQRFGTLQTVHQYSPDTLDRTAAFIILQAIVANDLDNITVLFRQLEGSPQQEQEVAAQRAMDV